MNDYELLNIQLLIYYALEQGLHPIPSGKLQVLNSSLKYSLDFQAIVWSSYCINKMVKWFPAKILWPGLRELIIHIFNYSPEIQKGPLHRNYTVHGLRLAKFVIWGTQMRINLSNHLCVFYYLGKTVFPKNHAPWRDVRMYQIHVLYNLVFSRYSVDPPRNIHRDCVFLVWRFFLWFGRFSIFG